MAVLNSASYLAMRPCPMCLQQTVGLRDSSPEPCDRCWEKIEAYHQGAAVAFGLMGMADAIDRYNKRLKCPSCGRDAWARHFPCTPDGKRIGHWTCDPCSLKPVPSPPEEKP